VVLVIDTSSPLSALALTGPHAALAQDVVLGGREDHLPARVRALADLHRLTAVAVCLGPGSFTGLRLGVSYGLGLAMGLDLPLLGFGSLELQGARATTEVTALVEAGRGRLYWQAPGGQPQLGEPADLPRGIPAVGWLRPATAHAVTEAGVALLGDAELAGFAPAAARLLAAGAVAEVGYDTVELRYMHSFVAGG
jgi:tRNA threonylcarbamoyladenosine biosynthesis protein TsaB